MLHESLNNQIVQNAIKVAPVLAAAGVIFAPSVAFASEQSPAPYSSEYDSASPDCSPSESDTTIVPSPSESSDVPSPSESSEVPTESPSESASTDTPSPTESTPSVTPTTTPTEQETTPAPTYSTASMIPPTATFVTPSELPKTGVDGSNAMGEIGLAGVLLTAGVVAYASANRGRHQS